MKYDVIVIGAGFSGLAAALRFSRYERKVLVLEAHHRPGGLSSWYTRDGHLFETGLHALTSFAEPSNRAAPINRLLRQLGLKRERIGFLPQSGAKVIFPEDHHLRFNNDLDMLSGEISNVFPGQVDGFRRVCEYVDKTGPVGRTGSGRDLLSTYIGEPLLREMLLFPLMTYSASSENDLDCATFLLMFRAVYLEGLFRPAISIKELLSLISDAILDLGGEIRYRAPVEAIARKDGRVTGVHLVGGEFIPGRRVVSTVGLPATFDLLKSEAERPPEGRLSFFESIYVLKSADAAELRGDETIYFYNLASPPDYYCPKGLTGPLVGSICLSHRYQGKAADSEAVIRVTNLGNYSRWRKLSPSAYAEAKKAAAGAAAEVAEGIIGPFRDRAIFHDSFTPVTINRFSRRPGGAIYGSPEKHWDGDLGVEGLLLAGTDQGLVGVVGAMISGVNIANRMLMPMRLAELEG